jgi:predicted transcriptional regulator
MTRRHAFGPLELKILGMFAQDNVYAASDVQAKLHAADDELAYTTVMTVLNRLTDKTALTRQRDGKRYVYRVSRNTARLKSGVVARLHRTLFSETKLKPFAALLESEDMSAEELRTLRRMVNAKLRELTS